MTDKQEPKPEAQPKPDTPVSPVEVKKKNRRQKPGVVR